jgi:serine/threonine protein kinase
LKKLVKYVCPKALSTDKIFARKIVRKFGSVTEKDIENEARAVSELCTAAQCPNVVEVVKHDWLTKDHGYYFIDMEYCTETLEEFIRDISKDSRVGRKGQNDIALLNGVETVTPVANDGHDVSLAKPTTTSGERLMDLDGEQYSSGKLPQQVLADNRDTRIPSPPTFPEDELIDWEALITIFKDITSGLIYIHSKKFVHRDLKPRNGTTFISFLIPSSSLL